MSRRSDFPFRFPHEDADATSPDRIFRRRGSAPPPWVLEAEAEERARDAARLRPAPSPRRGPRPSNPGAVAGTTPVAPPMAGAAAVGVGTRLDGGGDGADLREAPTLEGGVLPFRRTAVKPRRKRRSLWLRVLRPAVAALLLVSLPTAVAYWVLTSPRFDLAEVAVAGNQQVPAGWVRERLEPLSGENLVRLPLAGVEASLRQHPWIAEVAIQKRLPDALTVVVEERRAAVLVPGPDGEPWLADAEGRVIEPARPGAEERLVRLIPALNRGAAAGPLDAAVPGAVEVAAALSRAQPVWAAGLERIEALGQGDYRLHTRALPFPILVHRGSVEPRVARLGEALPGLAGRLGAEALAEVGAVDLRFSGRLVLRAAGTPLATPAAADTAAVGGADFRDVKFLGAMTDTGGPLSRHPGGDLRRKVG